MEVDSKDEHVKTVYAHFGLALYLAQVLEHGIVNALVYLQLLPQRAGKPIPREEWKIEFDSFMERNFQATLGRMIKNLRAVVSVPAELEESLSKALTRRNYLAHHFFRERAEDFMSSRGREEMIAELEAAQSIFSAADEQLSEVTRAVRTKFGFTDERVAKYFEEYRAKFEDDL